MRKILYYLTGRYKSYLLAEIVARQLGINTNGKSLNELLGLSAHKLIDVPYIQYPVSFSTVDFVPFTINDDGETFILLGRKYNQEKFQIMGGFRDPAETNAEAASRELSEEGGLRLPVERFRYIKDLFIDDSRYKQSPHKITTSLFLVSVLPDEVDKFKAGDDIEEIKWFIYDGTLEFENIVRPVHQKLFNEVTSALEEIL